MHFPAHTKQKEEKKLLEMSKNREIIPVFIVTGFKTIDDQFISLIIPKLEKEYSLRNSLL